MPIDPNIINQLKPADPFGAFQRAYALKQQMARQQQEMEMRKRQMDEMERSIQDEIKAREILGRYDDPVEALNELRGVLGDKAIAIEKGIRENQKAIASLDETKRKKVAEIYTALEEGVQNLNVTPDEQKPQVYQIIKGKMEEMYPGIKLPAEFSPSIMSYGNLVKMQKTDLELKQSKETLAKTQTEGEKGKLELTEAQQKEAALKQWLAENPGKTWADYEIYLAKQKKNDVLSPEAEEQRIRISNQTKAPSAPKSVSMLIPDGKGGYTMLTFGEGESIPPGAVTANTASTQNAPTAEQRNKKYAQDKTLKSVKALEDLSKKVINKRGIAQRAKAMGRSLEAVLGNDPEFRVYQDARLGLAGNLAVLQQGSRPSDADIKAIWLPIVPDVFADTDQSADMKWKLIKTMSGLEEQLKTEEPIANPSGRIKILKVE